MDLRATDIEVRLPQGRVLFGFSQLHLATGDHVLVQGESGRGKTTLLHLFAGLFQPTRGRVVLGDHDLTQMTDTARANLRRAHIGVIFQKLNLLDHLTAGENVGLSASTQIEESLRRVNLAGRAAERVNTMSLGEQQRVATARVLAQDPDLILADEPTSSLDATNAELVLGALKSAARDKTLVVVSHDARIAPQFDRVIRFEDLK